MNFLWSVLPSIGVKNFLPVQQGGSSFYHAVKFSPESFSSYSSMEMFLLAISGVVTAVPLLCFSEAVKRAPLNLIGFIQYLNPTIQLLVAILIFGETVSIGELKGFLFIWIAILVFVTGQIVTFRRSS